MPWPKDITNNLVSDANPGGTLTNSDLEMAALVVHYVILESLAPLTRKHIGMFSDNSPTVSWATKMASHASTPVAGRLIRALAMRQRTTQSAPAKVEHISGVENVSADVASQSFGTFHTTSLQAARRKRKKAFYNCLLTLFVCHYRIPIGGLSTRIPNCSHT